MSAHTCQTQLKLIGKLILSGELLCETGLHIGAGKGSLEIGGGDNPVVKDAFGLPYVPGSSLRGKLRSLLEQFAGRHGARRARLPVQAPRTGSAHSSERPSRRRNLSAVRPQSRDAWSACRARRSSRVQPVPLAWRCIDAPLDPESITAQMRENLDDEITEVKSENAIDRITSQANPRTLERVPGRRAIPGAHDSRRPVRGRQSSGARLFEGLRLLEDDALGGGGSRGSGRVRFANLKLNWRGRGFYSSGAEETELAAGELGQLQAAVNDSSFAEKLAS